MTVKELIKELNKHDKNADVCMGIAAYGEFWGVEDVVGTEGGSRVLLLDRIAPPWCTDEQDIRGLSYR